MKTSAPSFVDSLSSGFAALPRILGTPRLLQRWLALSVVAWIILVLSATLIPLVIVPQTDKVLSKIFKPTVSESLFGLIKTGKANPKLDTAKTISRIVLWSVAGCCVIVILARKAACVVEEEVSRPVLSPGEATIVVPGNADATLIDRGSATDSTSTVATLLSPPGASATGLGPQGRYRIVEELGRGAMGIVYRAHDHVLDREVAVKELPAHLCADQTRVERFRQEARTLAQISHPGIVQVFDLFDQAGHFYLVMELIHGGDLEGLLRQRGALPVANAARYGRQIAEALASVHARGIVHRDLKPANILINIDDRPKITDFGIARQESSQGLTIEGSILGSPEYMSPEQASGQPVDYRSDLYALGIILYRLFTGTVPFTGDLSGVLAQQITREPIPPAQHSPHTPAAINDLILSLLVKDPAVRENDLGKVSGILESQEA